MIVPDFQLVLQGASERLESAEILHREGNYRDAVSRAYYAVFEAARAALLTKQILPKSHAGTLTKFQEQFIVPGLVSKETSRILKRLEKERIEADYSFTKKFTPKESSEIIALARGFLATVKQLIQPD